ncbi:GatB/GatE catalytic domain-containing protein [Pisolithus orientalis]|uniref:GatB/GatE catalytic domain-containing protein n=1 Tax=Pisolithus orientalis TaxID=936130 RepID=UPI002224D141|nr:GatB/GatE catalytic domain-containing protein [Pisolithus orientalis]KAI6034909.1 GatB/GatE catalytic domain-containing protein [Pisolithus orientalis]
MNLVRPRPIWRAQQRERVEDRRWPGWEVVIGIEVHAQIKSRKKLFSAHTNEAPNTAVSCFDAALPGTLPSLNPKCVELAVRTALALNAHVQRRSAFDRKHYFYPDLPSGYQITQRYAPLARGGYLKLSRGDVTVRITQLQLEQDTAKSTFHADRRVSLVDLNRAGSGLMEIISEPDMRSPEEAGDYVRTLQTLLRAVGSSDGSMELGSLRCDINVSVNRHGQPPGTRCEIKNLNSIKFTMTAITSEVFRHIELLESGRTVPQETRGFDEDKAETFKLRSKEDSPDYRYMPDPNPPTAASLSGECHESEYIERVRSSMPELPSETRVRLLSMGLSERDADVLMTVDAGREVGFDGEIGKGAVAYFTDLVCGRDPKIVDDSRSPRPGWPARKETFSDNPVSVKHMGELIDMVQSGKVTGTSGKTLLRHMISHRSLDSPSKLAKELGLIALSRDDSSLVKEWCLEAIEELPQQAEAVKKGNLPVLNKLVGKVMKLGKGRANAEIVRTLLLALLRQER